MSKMTAHSLDTIQLRVVAAKLNTVSNKHIYLNTIFTFPLFTTHYCYNILCLFACTFVVYFIMFSGSSLHMC